MDHDSANIEVQLGDLYAVDEDIIGMGASARKEQLDPRWGAVGATMRWQPSNLELGLEGKVGERWILEKRSRSWWGNLVFLFF